MLKYKVKDLIQAAKDYEVFAIGHGCNCFNCMKSGIAPKIAKAFPDAFQRDQDTVKGDKGKLGAVTIAWNTNESAVFNLYPQYDFRGRRQGKMDLDYDALRSSLQKMAEALETCDTIGLPKIGAGLAGGDWSIIEKIIEEELTDKGYDVTIYVLSEREIPSGSLIQVYPSLGYW